MRKSTKVLSWLLSLALMLSLLPGMSLTAYADETKVGDATYTINNGVLTVGSGEFTIENWASAFGTGGTSTTANATAKSIKSVMFESGATLTDTSKYMFYGWKALKSVDLTNLTASNVTHIGFMFMNCQKLTSVAFGLGFDTSKVNNMRQMFSGCSYLTALDLSTFKSYTGNGTRNLYQMFYNCSNLKTIRVNDDWNVENAEGNQTFNGCYALEGGNGTKANGSGDYTKAIIDKDGQPGYFTSASVPVEHHHVFTYSASGSTLTATCSASDCTLTGSKVELTLKTPSKTVYGDSNSAAATLEGREAFNAATGLNIGSSQYYVYYKKGSDTSTGSAPTTPGEYTVKVTISNVAGGSYNLEADYTIAQKEVGLTWSDTEFNYDGTSHAPAVTATGLVGSDQCNVTITGEGTEIGTYTATATGLSNDRYKLPANATQQFSIVAKIGTASYSIDNGVLTVKSGSFTGEQWNAAFANSKATIKSVKFETGAVLTESAARMFKDWEALASVDFSHLTASDVKDMSQMFQGCVSLTELDLSVFGGYTGAGKRSLAQMFSGCSNLVTIRVGDDWNINNAEGSDTFSGCIKLIGENGTKCTGTGDYTKAVIDKDGQPGYLTSADAVVHWHEFTYSVSADGKTLTATCSVDGCNLTDHQVVLTLKAPEKTVYDDGKSAEATLEGKDAFKTATGTSGWNTISYYKKGSSASMAAPTTPGEYTAKVTISNVAGGPYELSVDYSIAQKEIGLTWGETTFHYDGKPHAPTATATGLVGSDKCDVIVTGEQTAIGTYTATATGLSNGWYKLPDENTTKEFDIEGWLGTARYTIESGKAPTKSKMLLKATNPDDDSLNDNYTIENGVLTVYSSSGTSTFTLEDWRLAFANDNFIRNYRDNITSVVFSNENETNVKLTGSAEGMFRDWAGLKSIDFTGLDTSEVTWMQNMFSGCVSLTELDLSPLNTKSVTNMANMFYKCSALKKIIVGQNWQTASSSSHMFSGCNMLDGGAGTTYQALFGNYIYTDDDPTNPTLPDVDGTYAHLDGGKLNPGFFYNAHEHQLTYTVDQSKPWTITATCSADGCYLGDSNNHSVSISLVRPTLYVYWMDELNKKDGEYDKGASPFATLTMQKVGDQTLKDSTTVADPDGKINGVSFSVATFNDANTAAPDFKALTGADIGNIEYYEKGSDTKLDKAPTDAGTYTAKVTIGDATASVDYRIAKRFHSPVLISPKQNASFAFGETEQELITVEENAIKKVDDTDTSTFEFALGIDATTIPTDGWSTEIPKGKGNETFYVFYRVAGDKNHGNAMESEFPNKSGYANTTNPEHASNSYKPAYSVIIVSNAAPIPPTPNELSYNGEDQALVTAGSATTGKMEYALGTDKTTAPTSGWSETIPTGKEPAVYYVWYRVVNANDPSVVINQPVCVQVPLGKATPTVTAPTGVTATYGQTLTKLSPLTNPTGNPEGAWTWVNPSSSVGNVGTNTFRATFTPTDKEHYKTVEADVTVTVSKADPTANAPTATATYGQMLKNVTLTNPQGNTPGTWTWKTPADSVGNAGTNTIKANFTPNDTDNYNSKSDVDVTVNVGKAANPTTVVDTATVKIENTIDLADNVKMPAGVTGPVSYQIGGSWNDCTLDGSVLTVGNKADTTKTVKVNVTVAEAGNYKALTATITVTISALPTQTITAEDVEVAYGETDKSVSATVTESNHGPISYTVKSGSEKYIAVDASTGVLTVKAVPLDDGKAYVIVTAAAVSGNYAETTKEVTVTINRAPTNVAAAPTAITGLTYNGSAQELVTAGTASSGCKLRYALGSETAATEPYSDSIPTATNAGTYYVWYYNAVLDNNHEDSVPKYVEVKVAQKAITVTADAKSVIYGNPTPALTYTVTGLVGSDTLTGALACEVDEKSNAGPYDITKGTLAASDNYDISFNNGTLTVEQKEVGLDWSNLSFTYDGQSHKPTATATYLVNNDAIVVSVSGEQTNAGESYTATASGLTGTKAGNYKLPTANTTTFTIGKAALTVTANDKNITYGEAPTNDGVTYDGFVNGETESVLSGTLDYDYSYAQYGDVGNAYTITPKGLTSNNYAITFVQGTLTVEQKEVGLDWSNLSFTYDGQSHKPTAAANGTVNDDEIGVTVTGEQTNAGTDYTATASELTGNKAGNYKLPSVNTQSFTITKLEIKGAIVKLDAFEYDTTVPNAKFINDETVDGKNGTIVQGDSTKNVTYYYQATAFLKSQTDAILDYYNKGEIEELELDESVFTELEATTFEPGKHYVLAVVTGDNYNNVPYITQSVFEVTKNTDKERTAPTAPTVDGTKVTVAEADRTKSLQYSLDGTTWKPVTLDENGEFTAEWATLVSNAALLLREAADDRYEKPSANATGTAAITTTTFTVTYDANGGINAPEAVTVTSDRTVTVSGKANMTRKGYTFTGWNTEAKGTGTDYEQGVKLTNGTTLYAQWEANTYKVRFSANGGKGAMEELEFTYDADKALTANAFERELPYKFLGWSLTANGGVQYQDKQSVKNLAESGTITLYAVWAKDHYNVSGTIKSAQTGAITLQLVQGNNTFGEEKTVAYNTANDETEFTLNGVPAGIYNLVATQGEVTMTKAVIITDDHVALELITMPSGNASSVIEVKSVDTPAVVVGGLDTLAEHEEIDGRKVKVAMAIEAQNEAQAGEVGEAIVKESRAQNAEFIDFTVTKTITNKGVKESVEKMNETNNVLELVIPFNFSGKTGIKLYRFHDGVEALKQAKGEEVKDGTYTLDQKAGAIHVYASKFSTYAITYSNFYPASDFAPTIAETEHGTITVEPQKAQAGKEVVITATPDAGYKLGELTVTDGYGKKLELTENEDGTYTFKQPNGKVTIEGKFIVKFVDVPENSYYAKAVDWAVLNGITNGVDETHFAPDATCTRAQAVTFLWRALGCPEPKATKSEFTDVVEGAFYFKAVLWAAENGITLGYGDGTFGVDDTVNRAQMVTFMERAMKGKAKTSESFTDVPEGAYYADAAAWAKENGISEGIGDNKFGGDIDCLRAQIVTMLYRYFVK